MATPVIMPRQGQSVESCIIAKWHKNKGDSVSVGDILFSYETDKASFEEEAKISGIMLDTFFEEGDDVPCLINVCVIGTKGEDTANFNPNDNNSQTNNMSNQLEKETDTNQHLIVPTKSLAEVNKEVVQSGNVKVSPRAKNMAEKEGIDYRYANPSGPYGRVIERDIIALKESGKVFTHIAKDENFKSEFAKELIGTGIGGRILSSDLNNTKEQIKTESQTEQPEIPMYDEVKISNVRKLIAKAMQNSLSSTAQLTLNTSFDATEILNFRKKLKDGKEKLGLENITINDIILFAVSKTLLNHRNLNANLVDDKMLYFRNVNLGIAVDTERGLMVPTLMNANLKSLNEIAKEVKSLAKDCQSGTISPDNLKNGSFTVTNLGTFGVESFTPVLNPPQTGILGVNTIVQRAKEVDGKYIFYPAMGLSLTFDHKAIDGAPAAKFLQDLKNNLENFSTLLAK